MHVTERFLKYITIDTTSDPTSETFPSTDSQLHFAAMLVEEMKEMGLQDVSYDNNGYVFATIPATIEHDNGPVLGLIAHMDTAPASSGANICPRIVENYDGGIIHLNPQMSMSPEDFACLKNYIGQDLIVTDGTTLLGGDDKAGLAEIMTAAEYLLTHPEIPHGIIRIGITPDEEIGQGADRFDVKAFGADFAYTMDGGEIGELEYENFNAASALIEVTGLSIHPGSAKNKMKNALRLAMELDQLLPVEQKPEYTEGREGFFHLDSMSGSVEHATMEYIIRDHNRILFQQKKGLMEQAVAYMNQRYGAGTFSLKMEDSYYNMREKIEPHMHLIESVLDIYKRLDITPKVAPIRGGTDGARLSFMGLPCPNLGTGDHNCHGPYEFVCIQSMETCVQVLIELCKYYTDFTSLK